MSPAAKPGLKAASPWVTNSLRLSALIRIIWSLITGRQTVRPQHIPRINRLIRIPGLTQRSLLLNPQETRRAITPSSSNAMERPKEQHPKAPPRHTFVFPEEE